MWQLVSTACLICVEASFNEGHFSFFAASKNFKKPSLDYPSGDSDHMSKTTRLMGIKDEVISFHLSFMESGESQRAGICDSSLNRFAENGSHV
ncbi:hypothetical protein L1987_06206 [Smallanthus sonchifolius]|uniref:Uncharacterized protein n=1 Tax=Smallanthus sonchifolius TaxID=185202 RepID=A0ACB9JXN8_9ASTR|nr:hypothetical protein L1987_06206 [Smallanthus sonchifolius]